MERYQRLGVLINNAGNFCMQWEETLDGFEKNNGLKLSGLFPADQLVVASDQSSLSKIPGQTIAKIILAAE